MSLILKTANPDDAKPIERLVNSAYRGESSRAGWTTEADLFATPRTSLDMLLGILNSSDQCILIFLDEIDLVACVHLKNESTHAYLGMLTVNPEKQASGIGKTILGLSEDWVQKNWGLKRIEMCVISLRKELIAWYQRRGYQLTGDKFPFPTDDPLLGKPLVKLESLILRKDFE